MPRAASQEPAAPRVLRLSPADNVGAATATIEPGEPIDVDGRRIVAADRVPTGHKIALTPIAAGEKVVKFGTPIGSATCDIAPGEYVHTHNLKSDYLPTYTLDGLNPYLREDSPGAAEG
jgi:altronate dehydratase small subunit